MTPQAKPGIAALAPYPLADSADPEVGQVINLASNEHAECPSPAVQEACRRALADGNRYPEASAAGLRQAIGRAFGLDPGRIVCANGSSELISILAQAYVGIGEEVVVGRHGYLFFSTAARIAGGTPVPATARDLAIDPDALIAAVTPRTRIVFLDNPSNPIGTMLPADALSDLRRRLPADVLLVLDAAYADYVTDAGYDPGAALVETHDNVVMLRTFSKIYGLAGFRVGWAYAPSEIADVLHRARQPNNLATVSIAAAMAALVEPALIEERRNRNAAIRDDFAAVLRHDFAFEVVPSHTNFLLARPPANGALGGPELVERLRREGILVRSMAPYELPNWLRITIGTASEMAVLRAALARAFG